METTAICQAVAAGFWVLAGATCAAYWVHSIFISRRFKKQEAQELAEFRDELRSMAASHIAKAESLATHQEPPQCLHQGA